MISFKISQNIMCSNPLQRKLQITIEEKLYKWNTDHFHR